MAFLEACLVMGIAGTAILTYRFFAIPMPPQAEETSRRRFLLLLWWILSVWTKLLLCFSKKHEMQLLRMNIPLRPHLADKIMAEDATFGGIPVRIYRPKDAGHHPLPGVIYFHGGGWCWELWGGYDEVLRAFSQLKKMVIVSVRYRLAPENPFPTATLECFAVTQFVLRNTQMLKMDPENLTLMGDSAGGNLAMAIMVKMLSSPKEMPENLPNFRKLVLIYPALQAVNFKTPSYQKYRGPNLPTILSSELMVKFYVAYALGMETMDFQELLNNCHWTDEIETNYHKYVNNDNLPASLRDGAEMSSSPKHKNPDLAEKINKCFLNPLFSPLLAHDSVLKELPDTYVLSAEMDPLRDDSFMFVNRLNKLGVRVRHRHWKGMDHGFMGNASLYKNFHRALREIVEYLEEDS